MQAKENPTRAARPDCMPWPAAWLMVALLCLVLLLTTISQYQVLLFSADFFNGLHYFFSRAQHTDSFAALFGQALTLSKDIEGGQGYLRTVVGGNFAFNYPPLLLSADWLGGHFQSLPYMESLTQAMCIGALAATVPSLVIFAVFVLALPRTTLLPALAVLVVIALLPVFPGRLPLALPEPLLHPAMRGSMRGEPIVILASLCLAAWCATSARLESGRARLAGLTTRWIEPASRWLLIAAVIAVLARLIAPAGVSLELLALALSAISVIAVGFGLRLPPLLTVAAAFTVYSSLYAQYFAFQATNPTPKGAAALAATGLLIYASRKPNGKLVWLMPSILLLHVSAGGLFALAVAVAETVVCLRRRKLSALLLAAVSTFVVSRVIEMALFSGIGEHVEVAPALDALLASGSALPGAALRLLPFGLVAAYLLGRRDERFDPTLRAALLLLQLAGLTAVSSILFGTSLDRYDPSVFVVMQAYSYLGAMLGFAIPLVVMSDLLAAAGTADEGSEAGRGWFRFDAKQKLIVAGFVLLLCVRGDYYVKYPDGALRAIERGLYILADPAGARPADAAIAVLRADDDRYLLRATKWWRPSDPLTYASMLKMLLRIDAGLLDPARVRIDVSEDSQAANWGSRETFAEHTRLDP